MKVPADFVLRDGFTRGTACRTVVNAFPAVTAEPKT